MTLDLEILHYGSKAWANFMLRDGIAVLKESRRVPGARISEVIAKIDMLDEAGYWWQARILRSWLHRCLPDLRPARPTTSEDGGYSKC
jgi:hypothetical protein